MNIEVFVLCRQVKQSDNAVDVIGIFNRVWASALPARLNNASIALRLNFTPVQDTAGIHTINISIRDEQGKIIDALSDSVKVDFEGHPGFMMDFCYELKDIGLPKFGEYTFNLGIDDKQACSIPLSLLPNKPFGFAPFR